MRNTVIGLIFFLQLISVVSCNQRNQRIPDSAKFDSEFNSYFHREAYNGIGRDRTWDKEGNLLSETIFYSQKNIVIRRTIENEKVIVNTWRYINRNEVIEVTVTYDEDGIPQSREVTVDNEKVESILFSSTNDGMRNNSNPIEDRVYWNKNQTINSMLLNGVLWVEIARDLDTGIVTETVYDREGHIINKLVKQGEVMIKEEILPWKPSDIQ